MVICKQEKRKENGIKFENAKRCDDECGSCAKDINDCKGCENRKRRGAGKSAGWWKIRKEKCISAQIDCGEWRHLKALKGRGAASESSGKNAEGAMVQWS